MQNIKIETVCQEDLMELVKFIFIQPAVCFMAPDDLRLPAVMKLYYELSSKNEQPDLTNVLPCNLNFSERNKLSIRKATATNSNTSSHDIHQTNSNTEPNSTKVESLMNEKSVEKRLQHLTDVETLMRTYECEDYYSLWAKVDKNIMYSHYAHIGQSFHQFVTFVSHGLRAEKVSFKN